MNPSTPALADPVVFGHLRHGRGGRTVAATATTQLAQRAVPVDRTLGRDAA